jgi:pilus assembly protein CpaB
MQQRQQTGGRTKAIAFLVVSILAAAGAAALVLNVINSANERLAEARAVDNKVDVVVATRELFVGLPITELDVAVKSFPPEIVPADVVFTSVDTVVGRTPKERVLPNEFVRSERLALPDSGRGLNAIIDSGNRAMSIFVNTESSVAGFIEPGNFIDVIVTIRPDDVSHKTWTTETLLQNIKVLAVGDSLTRPRSAADSTNSAKKGRKGSGTARAKPTVTLEVTPEEAQKLALATAKGDVHLALRSNIDSQVLPTKRVTAKDIIGYDPIEVAVVTTRAARRPRVDKPPQQESGAVVDVITGGQRTQVSLDADGNVTSEKTHGRAGR